MEKHPVPPGYNPIRVEPTHTYVQEPQAAHILAGKANVIALPATSVTSLTHVTTTSSSLSGNEMLEYIDPGEIVDEKIDDVNHKTEQASIPENDEGELEEERTRCEEERTSYEEERISCEVCGELKLISDYSDREFTDECEHGDAKCCTSCLTSYITAQLESNFWQDIRCPLCRVLMEYKDVAEFATKETFEK